MEKKEEKNPKEKREAGEDGKRRRKKRERRIYLEQPSSWRIGLKQQWSRMSIREKMKQQSVGLFSSENFSLNSEIFLGQNLGFFLPYHF